MKVLLLEAAVFSSFASTFSNGVSASTYNAASDDAVVSTHASSTCMKNNLEDGKYHADGACCALYDEAEHDSRWKAKLEEIIQKGPERVLDQKTVFCPQQEDGGSAKSLNNNASEDGSIEGFRTIWFVENTASTPVVVSWVGRDGEERSAGNPTITPAVADPDAILHPGSWRSFNTFEGHVFHVRELLEDGYAGELLVYHRAGLVPVGAQYQTSNGAATDIDNKEEEQHTWEEELYEEADPIRPCNKVDVGFRNRANVPLIAFWVHPSTPTTGGQGTLASTCEEEFKFHLGNKNRPQQPLDYEDGHLPATQHHGTFVGSTFGFRLAANPNVLVDTHTVQPVRVTDCPRRKSNDAVAIRRDGIALPVRRVAPIMLANNNTFNINISSTIMPTILFPSTAKTTALHLLNIPVDLASFY